MRTPNLTLYSNSRYQLNRLTSEQSDANEVMSSQKRINDLSDDPVGVSQVLDLKSTVSSLEQYNANIKMGITWLQGAEKSLDSVQGLLLKAKTLAGQMSNDSSVNATQRANEVETVRGYIDQIMELFNTRVNGSYIFGGTETTTPAFEYDDKDNPTSVNYKGNAERFFITTSDATSLEVGRVGSGVVTEDQIVVNTTNNKIFFTEDPGSGVSHKLTLDATVPSGTYTKQELSVAVQNAMNQASADAGYGVTYEVTYDTESSAFSIVTDGTYEGYMGFNMLWESGGGARVGNLSTHGIFEAGINIQVANSDALTRETPEDGAAPIRLTWDEQGGTWGVLNDPGYGLDIAIDGSDDYVALDLDKDGTADITVSLESAAQDGQYLEFDIFSDSSEQSIGPDMGFTSDAAYTPPRSSSEVALKSFDNTNNVIDFKEDAGSGLSAELTAVIPEGDYSDMNELAAAIESAMEGSSVNGIDYEVTWNANTNAFSIKENGASLTELQLLWGTGSNSGPTGISAAATLGFDNGLGDDDTGGTNYVSDSTVHLFSITTANNAINFKELLYGVNGSGTSELTANIAVGDYDDIDSFTRAVEDALEDASAANGNRVDYEVTYDYNTHTFSIEEDGTLGRKLEDFQLLWKTGSDSETSAAQVLGFDKADVASTPVEGEETSWTIFDTLYDFKDALASNDVDAIERAISRLDNHYNSITSTKADVGIKYNRLTTTQNVIKTSTSSLKNRKSGIEDADFIEATMNLTAITTAYQAALSATSQILNVSLVDYM